MQRVIRVNFLKWNLTRNEWKAAIFSLEAAVKTMPLEVARARILYSSLECLPTPYERMFQSFGCEYVPITMEYVAFALQFRVKTLIRRFGSPRHSKSTIQSGEFVLCE